MERKWKEGKLRKPMDEFKLRASLVSGNFLSVLHMACKKGNILTKSMCEAVEVASGSNITWWEKVLVGHNTNTLYLGTHS
jgi:hypothetical protein